MSRGQIRVYQTEMISAYFSNFSINSQIFLICHALKSKIFQFDEEITTLYYPFQLYSPHFFCRRRYVDTMLLKSLNEAEMQQMGMKISATDIYSVNNGSLKDAIVHFGGFCTSELISGNGLLLTNHHCGYGQIQSHSSIDNNLLKNGFWAKDHASELPNPGLTATFIDEIIDVSELALKGVKDRMSVKERQSQIDKNIEVLKSEMELEDYQEVRVRPFYHGNQYFAFITTTYRDVRLVGTPPESIGKFGSDTDNWVWPRHTGDFSLFRIYAGPDNLPADYSEENVPYQPRAFSADFT